MSDISVTGACSGLGGERVPYSSERFFSRTRSRDLWQDGRERDLHQARKEERHGRCCLSAALASAERTNHFALVFSENLLLCFSPTLCRKLPLHFVLQRLLFLRSTYNLVLSSLTFLLKSSTQRTADTHWRARVSWFGRRNLSLDLARAGLGLPRERCRQTVRSDFAALESS